VTVENEKEIVFDIKEDAEFITKYDLKIYDYENKKYINKELHKFEVQMMSIMTNKLENISVEISGIKSLLIEMLFGIIGAIIGGIILLFVGAVISGVI